jgi:hypothetical protein
LIEVLDICKLCRREFGLITLFLRHVCDDKVKCRNSDLGHLWMSTGESWNRLTKEEEECKECGATRGAIAVVGGEVLCEDYVVAIPS